MHRVVTSREVPVAPQMPSRRFPGLWREQSFWMPVAQHASIGAEKFARVGLESLGRLCRHFACRQFVRVPRHWKRTMQTPFPTRQARCNLAKLRDGNNAADNGVILTTHGISGSGACASRSGLSRSKIASIVDRCVTEIIMQQNLMHPTMSPGSLAALTAPRTLAHACRTTRMEGKH